MHSAGAQYLQRFLAAELHCLLPVPFPIFSLSAPSSSNESGDTFIALSLLRTINQMLKFSGVSIASWEAPQPAALESREV